MIVVARPPVGTAAPSRIEGGLFAAALAIALATALDAVRLNGLALLLILTLLAERRVFTIRTFLLAASLLIAKLLRVSGNWYMAHAVVDFVIVTAAVATALLSWPESLSARLPRLSSTRIAVLFVALPVFLFLMRVNPSVATGDSQPVLPTVVQMLRHGNRNLASWNADGRWASYCFTGQPYFLHAVPSRDGLYSAYPAGMELFAAPVVCLAMLGGADLSNVETLARLERLTAGLLASASLALFFLLASHFARRCTAYVATLLLATGSTFASTSGFALWQQCGVCFWILVVLLCEARGRGRWLQAFACAAMLACRPSSATFLVPFGLWVLANDWRRGLLLPLRSIACYLPWAWLYMTHYGSPFGPSMHYLTEAWGLGANVPGVLVSPARGLLIYQPWLLLVLLRPRHEWRPLLLAAMGLHVLLVSSWPMWWGGHCYGSRLLAEIVPLLGLLILQPLEVLLEKKWGRWLVGGIAVLGLLIHLPGAYGSAMAWNFKPLEVDAHPERLWQWRDAPFLFDFRP